MAEEHKNLMPIKFFLRVLHLRNKYFNSMSKILVTNIQKKYVRPLFIHFNTLKFGIIRKNNDEKIYSHGIFVPYNVLKLFTNSQKVKNV